MGDPLVCSENKQFHQALKSERKTKILQQVEKDGHLKFIGSDHMNFKKCELFTAWVRFLLIKN